MYKSWQKIVGFGACSNYRDLSKRIALGIFEKILDMDSSVLIHTTNLLTVAIEIYKVKVSSYLIMNEIFKLRAEGRCFYRTKSILKCL